MSSESNLGCYIVLMHNLFVDEVIDYIHATEK